ncbi:interleukin-21 receptor isoform X2 [Scomber japonicus]|uniref:interleukin-21 receptor isoform X2 n=1 Tax=Scomber japonicus TaxID=13676 RepID=UPI0023056F0D|nr:interleukin-21 receptor isoform X2 [Scomber japonicus]
MDPSSPLRLMLFLFLFVSPNIICLHGYSPTDVDRSFHCTNDYLSTINCSLGIISSEIPSDTNSSYWLYLQKECEKEEGIEGAVCMLTNTNEDDFCAVNTADGRAEHMLCPHIFVDMDSITISLCHNQSDGSKSCIVLHEMYEPVDNITPNAPCCLAVSQNASEHHFTWKSTYEEFSSSSNMNKNLIYQLNYYKRRDKQKAFHDIHTESVWFSTDDNNFMPNTEYAARVRSSPNGNYYRGEWSSWSSEVHWTTDSVSSNITPLPFVHGLGMKMIIPLFVIVPLIVLLCYAPIKKWRQGNFIPTPAPYFQTLYSDCHGDFKSWVVTHENTTDTLNAEQTLPIDTLTKYAYVQEEDSPSDFQQNVMKGSTYENIINSDCDSSLLGIPYAVSTMAPMSASGSPLTSCTLSLQSGSPAEGDSGCWLCSEYCTLSAFQHSCSVPVEYSGKPPMKSCSTEMIRVDAIAEA